MQKISGFYSSLCCFYSTKAQYLLLEVSVVHCVVECVETGIE